MNTGRQNFSPIDPDSPRPSSLQITGARIQIYAQNHPASYALRCAALAGGLTVPLALFAVSPSLANPAGVPGWSLVWVLIAILLAALATGILTYTRESRLPHTAETDPVRYASATLQAASGAPGPNRETNRLARTLYERLVRAYNPGLYAASLFVAIVFVALLPLADITGPGFQTENLTQPIPLAGLLVAVLFLYYCIKIRRGRFEAFRATYDQQSGPLT